MRAACFVSGPMMWPVVTICILLSLDHVPAAPEVSPETASDLKELGINYTLKKSTGPVPNRIHVLRIDLAPGKVEPAVVLGPDPDGDGPAEASLADPRKMASDPSVCLLYTSPSPRD